MVERGIGLVIGSQFESEISTDIGEIFYNLLNKNLTLYFIGGSIGVRESSIIEIIASTFKVIFF
jgi:hypothetical protein